MPFGQPQVFLDCDNNDLTYIGTDLLNENNKPNALSSQIATGRIEDFEYTLMMTLSLTIIGSISLVIAMVTKF